MRTAKSLAAVGTVLLIFGGCLFLPCLQRPVRDERVRRDHFNLQQIAMAIHGYHDFHRMLPPAVIRDNNGKPLYGWRVAILPFIEQGPLYRQFRLDEPWDSPDNKKLLERTPPQFASPWTERPDVMTHYQVIIGPGSAFERDGLTLKHDFPDGFGDTFLVVAARESVPWSSPADVLYHPKAPVLPLLHQRAREQRPLCYLHRPQLGFGAVFVDGSTRFLPAAIDEQTLHSLVTRNGGEAIDRSNTEWPP
jgi:hypothetical protein